MDIDPSVIARLQAGDVAALEVCYRAFGPRVQRLCRKLVGVDHAEDAAQEVFLKLFERAPQFTGKSRFSTWLYQITFRHCLKLFERERRRATVALTAEHVAGGSELGVHSVDLRDQVERWIAALPPEHRAVVVLREVEGLDYKEIAEILSLPVGTVMSRLHRAREKIIEHERRSRARPSNARVQPT